MRSWQSYARTALSAALLATTAAGAAAQDNPELASARELYASAAYDESLTVLNRLRANAHAPTDSRAIEQYRALCLLALGRASDAEEAIAAVVAAEPSFHPSDDVSPRIRTAFAEVRRRMLPAIIQQKYADAKSAFDRKDYAAAARGFSQVLLTLADPDVGAAANTPPLADLRTLSVGFEELSAKAAAPPPPPPTPAPAVVAAAPAKPVVPRVYSSEDTDVTPPAVLNQTLPTFRGTVAMPRTGRIVVTIDQNGEVEAAMMEAGITAAYDKLAVAAARLWRFQPATVNGIPVKYRKVVQINVKPTT